MTNNLTFCHSIKHKKTLDIFEKKNYNKCLSPRLDLYLQFIIIPKTMNNNEKRIIPSILKDGSCFVIDHSYLMLYTVVYFQLFSRGDLIFFLNSNIIPLN